MKRSTVLVTGATAGIGHQTALELGGLGARVLVHGRDLAKAEAAVASMKAVHRRGRYVPVAGDLSSIAGVRALAAAVRAEARALDVLVNNAGLLSKTRELTVDGLELTFMVNHLAPMLLTHELLPELSRVAPARVLNVSSLMHVYATTEWDLEAERGYFGPAAYALSKLGNVLFTYSLADRYPADRLGAFALHPGGIATKLHRLSFPTGGDDVTVGARTPVFLATSREVAGLTGLYYENERMSASSPASRARELRERMWRESTRRLKLDWP